VAVEGAKESASTLSDGIEALATGVEEPGVGVEEAIEGIIIDIITGAYFFAFSKKPQQLEKRASTRRANLLPVDFFTA
jgi:hypothetical protein